ncbi:poly(A) RNA polymerase gld-2 homolog A-like isoform X2 [Cylas formicarius]|nr:poly(A) RNA polymerase gld-2 homolog A-like isoform X2 [Cylas formicarius]
MRSSTKNRDPQTELNEDLMSLPINLLPSPYLKENDHLQPPDDVKGLYKPISPKEFDDDDSYFQCFRVASDPGVNYDVHNGFSQLNPAIMFSKINHLSREVSIYDNRADYQQTLNNLQYQDNSKTFRNNYNRNFNKLRSNTSNGAQTGGNLNKIGNNRKRHQNATSYLNDTDVMVRRAYGLSLRFKSKSEVMKIDPNPEQLLSGSPLDELNREMWDLFISKAQKIETYENKILFWKDLFLYIRRCVSHYSLYIVGSTMTGFGLDTSDVDMCLLIRPCTENPRFDSLQHLNNIRLHLIKYYGLTIDPELILAKVPILKFRDESTGFEIDLNCNNSVGIHNTHLLYCYARLDWRIRPLVVVIKLWAKANGINDAKNLTVSSYSWTLMMIHYLQCGVSPPVLPCLHTLHPELFGGAAKNRIPHVHEDLNTFSEFRSQNDSCLADLLIGFFKYYSTFDFARYAISVRAGTRLPVDDCKNNRAPKNDPHQWKYMGIEEPFDFSNTARSVYDIAAFRHIKDTITGSYEALIATRSLDGVLPLRPPTRRR